jgi:mRNA interferase YafQ
MRPIHFSNKFKKNLDLMTRRGKNPEKIKAVIVCLANDIPLEPKHKDHPLAGNFEGFRDCHIEPDWLLIYRLEEDTLYLERTGTHNDLFRR